MSEQYEHLDLIRRVVATYLDMNPDELTAATRLDDDLDLDSTELVCVAVDLERALGFSLKGIPFGSMDTLTDLAVAVARQEGELAMA